MKKELLSYVTVDKPLLFKSKNITKISELIKKRNANPSSGNDNEINNGQDDEELFDYLISKALKESESSQDGKKEIRSKKSTTKVKVMTIKHNEEDFVIKEDKSDSKYDIQYNKYFSTIFFSNNKINTIENIHNDLMVLLPEPSIKTTVDKLALIQWIDLSYNKLTSIHLDIAKIPYLKILYLNYNEIKDLNQVTALRECKNLTTLSMDNNPIEKIKGYRQFVIEMCPVLEKLDNSEVTEKELDIIYYGGSKYGEKRENGNGKVIKYPKPSVKIKK